MPLWSLLFLSLDLPFSVVVNVALAATEMEPVVSAAVAATVVVAAVLAVVAVVEVMVASTAAT